MFKMLYNYWPFSVRSAYIGVTQYKDEGTDRSWRPPENKILSFDVYKCPYNKFTEQCLASWHIYVNDTYHAENNLK